MREKPKLRSRALRYINAVHAADDRLDHETRAVLIALGSHLSQQDWIVWPSVRRLAKMTKLSERTVKRRRNQIVREHGLAQDMGSYYGEWRGGWGIDGDRVEPPESRVPRKLRKWRRGGRPPLSLKLDLVALMKFRRYRVGTRTTDGYATTMVTGSPEAKVTGGPETPEGRVSG